MIATATPGQQGPDSVTHSGPASVGARKDPTGQEHAPFKGPHDYARQELVAPPEPIGKLGNLRPQVAKLRTLGFFWPDEMRGFSRSPSPLGRLLAIDVSPTITDNATIGAPVAWELVHASGLPRNELGTG